MALRLRRTAAASGCSQDEVQRVDRAFRIALEKRVRVMPEPDPRFLHPARTALILLADVGLRDCSSLEAALLFDSQYVELTTSAEEAGQHGLGEAAARLSQLPRHGLGEAELLEALVVLDSTDLAVALAERLDHARHLHFTPAVDWPAFHRQVVEVYMPVARRSGILADRFDAWAEAFGRRLARNGTIGR